MSSGHDDLVDTAVRDIAELDAQVAAGEITPERAEGLRRRYEARAAAALAAADDVPDPHPGTPRRAPRAWTLAYILIAVVAVVAAVVVLPSTIVDRPEGGAVTGIEPLLPEDGEMAAAPRDPYAISDNELMELVAENPDSVGIRLALADRYAAAGEFGAAMRVYMDVVGSHPDDPDARVGLASLLLQIGQDQPALENADRAVELQPDSIDAAWVQANVLISGHGDIERGVEILERLAARPDLPPMVRSDVDDLLGDIRDTGRGTS